MRMGRLIWVFTDRIRPPTRFRMARVIVSDCNFVQWTLVTKAAFVPKDVAIKWIAAVKNP